MGYKESIYNVRVRLDGEYYIYNTLFGSCLTHRSFTQLAKSDFSSLVRIHMMVPSDIDEYAMTQLIYNKGIYSAAEQSFFIAPTLTCDFTCPYCYAPHEKAMMDAQVADKVADFIIGLTKNADDISLSWIGGEPLLNWKRICQISEKLRPALKGKNISSSIVTNGYYLTNAICDALVDCGVNAFVLTLDGSAEVHDKRRVKSDGEPTFSKIIENLTYLATKEAQTIVRMNVDYDNVLFIFPLIDFLKSEGLFEKIYLSLVPVKQFDPSNKYTVQINNEKEIEEAISKAIDKRVNWGGPNPVLHCCSGVKLYDFSIGPEGELYACPIAIGKTDSIIGSISQSLPSREYYSWYSYEATVNKEKCKSCPYFPLCLSNCRWINRNVFQRKKSCSALIENYRVNIKNYIMRSKVKQRAYPEIRRSVVY